jgi:hypothetical protein
MKYHVQTRIDYPMIPSSEIEWVQTDLHPLKWQEQENKRLWDFGLKHGGVLANMQYPPPHVTVLRWVTDDEIEGVVR